LCLPPFPYLPIPTLINRHPSPATFPHVCESQPMLPAHPWCTRCGHHAGVGPTIHSCSPCFCYQCQAATVLRSPLSPPCAWQRQGDRGGRCHERPGRQPQHSGHLHVCLPTSQPQLHHRVHRRKLGGGRCVRCGSGSSRGHRKAEHRYTFPPHT